MRSFETDVTLPLSAVKPLDQLVSYRAYCLDATRKALQAPVCRRSTSPVSGAPLEPYGTVEGLAYVRCPDSGSLFLAELPDAATWSQLLADTNQFRHSPAGFHDELAAARASTVYVPKLHWIQDTLRLQQIARPHLLEITTPPSDFTGVLERSELFARVVTVDEMSCAAGQALHGAERAHAAVMLESLDRVPDPQALVRSVADQLVDGGLLFVTALVSSGFDMVVLGLRNLYLYPPDRTNCFSRQGLASLLTHAGFSLLEVSTPGALDLEIVRSHAQRDATVIPSPFEQQLLGADTETQAAFQTFLQHGGMSSFARIVGKKQ